MSRICVAGLGSIGLPLAVAFDDAGHDVVGYDVDPETVESLRAGEDPAGEVDDDRLADADVRFVTEPELSECEFVLLAVPTPLDGSANPNLRFVRSAARTVGRHLSTGTTVVLESTVYPGATREVLVPALEEASRLTAGEEFSVGYSPERMVPGTNGRDLSDIVKVVSGLDDRTVDRLAALYDDVVDAGIHRAPSIEVAEATKCVENAQRDLNIAFVNELAMACDHLDLDADAVLDAAAMKWNFHEYRPGLVGGHCLPVDPHYLTFAFERAGYSPKLLPAGRETNERVPEHVAELTCRALDRRTAGRTPIRSNGGAGDPDVEGAPTGDRDERVLVLGVTYKPDTRDVRSVAIRDLVDELRRRNLDVVGYDPHVDPETVTREFGVDAADRLSVSGFDGLVLSTPHQEFRDFDLTDLRERMAPSPALVDVEGVYADRDPEQHGFAYERL